MAFDNTDIPIAYLTLPLPKHRTTFQFTAGRFAFMFSKGGFNIVINIKLIVYSIMFSV